MYEDKLLGNTASQTAPNNANGILKNATIVLPLKFFSNFLITLKMSLNNCKLELKLKWTKFSVLSAVAADNANANSNNISFSIKDTNLYLPGVILSAKDNRKLPKLRSKEFERSVYWNEHKTKSENKNITNEYRYFLESNFVGVNKLFVLAYTNQHANVKTFNAWKYYLPKGIIKTDNVIPNGKNFYDQPIDSDIKRHKEIGKLATGQGEDYTTGCLLDYDYIKNRCRLIVVALSRHK